MEPHARVHPLLVLGAGPVGCAAAQILNAPCVGSVLGGHLEGPPAGPFLIWRDPAAARYLRQLGLPVEETVSRFGYIKNRLFTTELAAGDRESYYRRTRGLPETAPVPESAMSSGLAGEVASYAVSRDALRTAMTRVTFLKADIVRIEASEDPQGKFWKLRLANGELRARRIVSTLPAPVFYKLCPQKAHGYEPGEVLEEFVARPKVFLVPRGPIAYPYLPRGYDYAYAVDRSVDFDRVTGVGDGDEYREVFEFNDKDLAEAFDIKWHGYKLDRLTNPFGQVVSRDPARPLPVPAGVPRVLWDQSTFVGRLARWQHGERLHTALRDLYSMRDAGFR